MDLYVKKDCQECDEVKQWIDAQNIKNVNLLVVEQKDGQNYVGEEAVAISSFPSLFLGETGGQKNYLSGKEGIRSYLSKGFIHEIKTCPFIKTDCIEKKCEKFAILLKGMIPEGACSDYWTPILLIETMGLLKSK